MSKLIVADASVAAKWYLTGEPDIESALLLWKDVLGTSNSCSSNFSTGGL